MQKSAVKFSTEKQIVVNFENLSKIFCQRFSEETKFYLLTQDHLKITVSVDSETWKRSVALETDIWAPELWEQPIFDTFLKALSCTINCKFGTHGLYLWGHFLEFLYVFKEAQYTRKIFRQSSTKYIWTFSRFNAISLHHKGNWTRLFSPEKEYMKCLMSCQIT